MIYTEEDGVDENSHQLLYKKQDKPDIFNIKDGRTELLRLSCKECGGDNFNVGQGVYYTAIKCVVCKWECCIHNGGMDKEPNEEELWFL